MPYSTHDFESGDILLASQLNEMDGQIAAVTEAIESGSAGSAYTINTQESGLEIVANNQNSGS